MTDFRRKSCYAKSRHSVALRNLGAIGAQRISISRTNQARFMSTRPNRQVLGLTASAPPTAPAPAHIAQLFRRIAGGFVQQPDEFAQRPRRKGRPDKAMSFDQSRRRLRRIGAILKVEQPG